MISSGAPSPVFNRYCWTRVDIYLALSELQVKCNTGYDARKVKALSRILRLEASIALMSCVTISCTFTNIGAKSIENW